jgi:hypothetical protein
MIPREYLEMSRDIFGCQSWDRCATDLYWVESEDSAERPTMNKAAIHNKKII